MRTGIGYDIHKLVKGRALILGGVKIKYEKGLMGHSDADVVIHSICDALLGAASLGDIGKHFPPTDEKYKNIFSLELLKNVHKKIKEKNYEVNNIDVTIICESPTLSDWTKSMCQNISNALNVTEENISIKATTNEGLGAIGKGKAISAFAVATINE